MMASVAASSYFGQSIEIVRQMLCLARREFTGDMDNFTDRMILEKYGGSGCFLLA